MSWNGRLLVDGASLSRVSWLLLGELGIGLLYGVLGASPIPSEPLTVLLSTVFGPFYATLAAG